MFALPPRIRGWLREPLVHFLAIGALLFAFFEWTGGGAGPDSSRIVVGPGQIGHLAVGFARTWQRPPTPEELKGLVDDYVREEIAAREARSLGLDREDTVIRRRLRQKLEFLAEDAVESAPPTDEELGAWLEEHADTYHLPPEVAFRQVYLSPDRRGSSVDADAARLRERLSGRGPDAEIDELGDSIMLPADVPLAPLTLVARTFGEEFAKAVAEIEPGAWTGPVPSGYGVHLVYVMERLPARLSALEEVRDAVARDFMTSRRRRQLESMYERLLEQYTVEIDMPEPPTESAADGAATSSRAGR